MTKRHPMTYERGESPQNDRTLSRKREDAGSVAPITEATDLNKTCDQCNSQEEGGHYCLIHSTSVHNMNLMTCPDWESN